MSAQTPRLLIIDDQPESVALLVACLADNAIEAMMAQDGADGLAKATAVRPDLVVLDVVMADMNGLDICRELKANPRTANIPVIILSGSTSIEDKLMGFSVGAVDYIVKPFSEREVAARILLQLRSKQRFDRLETMVAQSALERVGDEAFPDEVLYSQALAVLNERLAEPPGLLDLARELGTNERRLTEIFRQRVGMTVFDYFSEMRLETSRHLLGASGMRIQTIASHVGYRNAGDFTRAYRRRYGVSPREYRQMLRGDIGDGN